mmetsp:Transcript_5306/g.16461  ORF Transcript_5306/g.16461 Transcript_5306/m.16461 type:complete len:381 (+) Transcript_5306:690-1832(+)
MVRRRVVPGLHHVRRSAQGQEPLSDGRQGRRATHEADQDGPRGQGLATAPPGRARRLRVGDGGDGAAPRRLLLAARPLEGRGGRGDARRPGEAQGRALRHVLGFPPERPRRQRHGDDGIRRDVPQVAGRRRVAEPLVPGLLLRISRRRHGGVVGEVHRQRGGALGAAPQVHQLAAGAGRAPDVVQGRQLRLRRERRRRREPDGPDARGKIMVGVLGRAPALLQGALRRDEGPGGRAADEARAPPEQVRRHRTVGHGRGARDGDARRVRRLVRRLRVRAARDAPALHPARVPPASEKSRGPRPRAAARVVPREARGASGRGQGRPRRQEDARAPHVRREDARRRPHEVGGAVLRGDVRQGRRRRFDYQGARARVHRARRCV